MSPDVRCTTVTAPLFTAPHAPRRAVPPAARAADRAPRARPRLPPRPRGRRRGSGCRRATQPRRLEAMDRPSRALRVQGSAVGPGLGPCLLRGCDPPIAVRTALHLVGSGRPPRGSQRAALPHWALASGSDAEALFWPGMQNAYRGDPALTESLHSCPGGAVTLTSAAERAMPVTGHLGTEPLQRMTVRRNGVIQEMSCTTLRSHFPCSGMR